jgi:beta-N-acetylhexosaminidase
MLSSRTFSSEPDAVGRFAAAFVRGLQGQAVMAVVKHFPGLGGAREDTHVTVPRVGDSFAVVRDRDLAPFRRVFRAGAGGVMLGHHAVLELDHLGRPATVSPPIAQDLLRGVMGFEGLVFTDALNMQAITEELSDGDLAVEALAAGADVLLFPRDPERAVTRIVDAVRTGRLSEARINESVGRVLRAKVRLGVIGAEEPSRTEAGPAVDPGSAAEARAVLGAPEHRRVIREIQAAASSTSPR